MVILDQTDLDRTTADALVNAQVEAVVNAAQSISGRFPNLGPEVLVASGDHLLDDVGIDVFNKVREGVKVRINDDKLYIGERRVALGVELVETDIADRMIEAVRRRRPPEAFSGNAIEYLRSESPLLIDGVGVPEVDAELDGMHVVVVADGPDHAAQLRALKPFIREYSPVMIGVGAGADILYKAGHKPALIVGDPGEISRDTLRCGAQLVLPADTDGHAAGPPASRIRRRGDHVPRGRNGLRPRSAAGRPPRCRPDRDRRIRRRPRRLLRPLAPRDQPVDVLDAPEGGTQARRRERSRLALPHARIGVGIALLVLATLAAVIATLMLSATPPGWSTTSSSNGTTSRPG